MLRSSHILLSFCLHFAFASAAMSAPFAQESKPENATSKIVTLTTQEDHREMQKQLGITKLRHGPSGNPSDPNAANTDESKANPYPELPELMTLKNGEKVTSPEQWWKVRRPEIVEDFEREVLGRIPDNVPEVKWELLKTVEKKLGETEVIEKRLAGRVDNSTCPEIEVNIMMSVVTPKNAQKPVPLLMMFGFTGFRADGSDFVFPGGRRFGPRPGAGPPKTQQLIEAGWGYANISAGSIQDDSGGSRQSRFGPPRPANQTSGGLTRGIIGLTSKGQPRKPDDWGSLRAWGWGASRGLDYLETDPAVDAKKVGIDGVSRYGKAALVTMAFDQRFATALVGSSGEGGASLYRRNFGEAVENLTGSGEYHWMAGNFLKYGTEESSFGSKNANDLPVDAHQLIALCAPRMIFISYGIPEKGDALWLDQQGSFMATIAAQPAFRLLGARDLGRSDDHNTEKMPAVNVGLLDGQLAWRQHDGGHTDEPNIKHFVKWADKLFGEKDENYKPKGQSQDSPAESKEHDSVEQTDNNSLAAHQQTHSNRIVIPLWDSGAPGFESKKDEPEKAESYWVKNIHNPSITAFLPPIDIATGAAVIVCPGGGHRELVFKAEGVEAAEYLNKIGVAVFALKYRLGREEGSPYNVETHALQDGQRAMRLVRSRAKEWGLDSTRIGMLGFSAGGEVVSMVAYADGAGVPDSADPIERVNSKPSFQMLVYPGGLGIPETIPGDAPPAFLLVANDDFGASRSITSLIPKMRTAGVPMEVHLYARGGHAFNMGNRSELKTLKTWPDRMHDWMKDNFILDTDGREEYLKEVKVQQERMENFRKRMRERQKNQEKSAPSEEKTEK